MSHHMPQPPIQLGAGLCADKIECTTKCKPKKKLTEARYKLVNSVKKLVKNKSPKQKRRNEVIKARKQTRPVIPSKKSKKATSKVRKASLII